jgi:hypothetical protein
MTVRALGRAASGNGAYRIIIRKFPLAYVGKKNVSDLPTDNLCGDSLVVVVVVVVVVIFKTNYIVTSCKVAFLPEAVKYL